MPRAKSRLKQKKAAFLKGAAQKNRDLKASQSPSFFKTGKKLAVAYVKHLPTLLLGLIFSTGTYFILTRIPPSNLQHILLPNSYLPFLIMFFLSSFFLLSYLLLNSRRGFLLAFALNLLLFLKLQQAIIDTSIILSIIIPIFIIELSFNLVNYKT